MIITDTHCHLDFEKFDPDRQAVLERALQVGIERILIPGLSLASSISAVKLAHSHPVLFAGVGVHPTEVAGFDPTNLVDLENLAHDPKVKAIGEIGLDYYWTSSSRDRQQQLLVDQLSLAAKLHLPVVIHFRENLDDPSGACVSDLLKILDNWCAALKRTHNPLAERPGVLHSFSGNLEIAHTFIDLGFFIGVSGAVTWKNNLIQQEVVAEIPLNRILIETDAPFQTPHPHRGKRNEPAYVRLIADKIASVRAGTTESVAEATTRNSERLFSWE